MKRRIFTLIRNSCLLLLLLFSFNGCLLEEGEELENPLTGKLVVVPFADEIEVGDTVHFDIILFDELVEADLFVNNEKISGTDYLFEEDGYYEVFAQREGVENSDTLTFAVGDVSVLGKLSLQVLSQEEDSETKGQRYEFSVSAEENTIEDAEIYVDDEKITGYKHTFPPKGTPYLVYAKKNRYLNSDTLEIRVEAEDLPKLSLTGPQEEVEVGANVTLSPMYFEGNVGQFVKDAKVYVDDELVELVMEGGYSFIWIPEETGVFKAFASLEGYENSDTIEITVVEEIVHPQMILIPSETEVPAGTTVNFEVEVEEQGERIPVPSTAYFLLIDNGNPESGDSYTFEESGVYSVTVSPRFSGGYEASEPVLITVSERGNPLNADVQVVGFEGTSSSAKAMLWKRGASPAVTLGDGIATDVYNFYGGIYISGYEMNSSGQTVKAKYWNGEEEVILENGNSRANSVMVEPSDGGVVVGGSVGDNAVYWNWDMAETIGSETGVSMEAMDVIWDYGEIYAAGNTEEDGQLAATIWAYGDRWELHSGSGSYANAIAVNSDGAYFVAGGIEAGSSTKAVYWDDAGDHTLPASGAIFSMANDIALQGQDMYIVGDYQDGSEWRYAVIWIDNTMYKLNSTDKMAGANAVVVGPNGNIYVAGWTSATSTANRVAAVWIVAPTGKSGPAMELTDGTQNAEARGIVMDE